MSRPVDWTPLCDSDPVRGDPVEVATMGRQYTTVAEAISSAAASLRRLANSSDGQISKAVDAMNDDCDEVASNISKAHERYAGVGEALTGYAPHLESAQATSLRALTMAQQAAHEKQAAGASTTETSTDDELAAAKRRGDAADGDLAAAQRVLDGARQERDDAAQVAIGKIKDVQDSGDLNDSWWDNWGSKIVSVIQKIASAVATIAGILALCVGWIPIIGQALAAVLGTIALVATAISLVCNIALAATGKGDWGSVIWDAVSLATFGAGRALGALAKGSSKAAQGLSRMTAGTMAGRSGGSLMTRALLNNSGLSSMSRNAARTMFSTGTREGALNGGNVLRSLRGIPGEFGQGISTLRGADLAAVRSAMGPALSNIVHGGGLRALYGETKMLAHSGMMRGLSPALAAGSPDLAHAIRYSNILNSSAVGANLAGNLQDIKSGIETVFGGGDGGDPLNLSHDELAR